MLNTITTIICALPVVFQFIEMVSRKEKNLKVEKFSDTLKYGIHYKKFYLLAMGAFGLVGVIMTARFGMVKSATPRIVICCIIAVLFIKYLEMNRWKIIVDKEELRITTLLGNKVVQFKDIDSVKCKETKKIIYSGGKKVATIADTVIGFNEIMKILKRKRVNIEY